MNDVWKEFMSDIFDLVDFWVKLSNGSELRRIVKEWTGKR